MTSRNSSVEKQESGEGIAESEILDLLRRLVEKSLVVYEEDADSRGRYRLLDTMRNYGGDLLREAEDADAWRLCHRDFYLGLAEEARTRLLGPEQAVWLDTLETEHDNLREALRFSAEAKGMRH